MDRVGEAARHLTRGCSDRLGPGDAGVTSAAFRMMQDDESDQLSLLVCTDEGGLCELAVSGVFPVRALRCIGVHLSHAPSIGALALLT